MKVAILGGGGCFALNFAEVLAMNGIDHFGIGRSPQKEPAFWQVSHDYRYYQAHLLRNFKGTLNVLDEEKPDVIVNFAAQGEGAASFGDYAADFFLTNCVGLINLVGELRRRDYWKRFIQIGSSEIYGSPDHAAREDDPLDPTSPYSISKAAFDQYLVSMFKNFKFPMNIVRPSNCYVPGQQLHRIIPKTMVMALKGHKVPLHGGGRAAKSYMHAADLSIAILRIIRGAPFGEIYNVGPDRPIEIRQLIMQIAEVIGIEYDDLVEVVGDRVGQDSRYWLDSTKIKKLGWTMQIPLRNGLEEMWHWVKTNPGLTSLPLDYQHRA